MKNQILKEQNEQEALERLAAQRELYSSAKRIFGSQALLTVVIPVLLACFGIAMESWTPYIAWYGIIVFVFDLLFLEPLISERKEKAAKIQELFDCSVLHLGKSELKTVDDITVEDVLKYYNAHSKIATNIERIRDWYPQPIAAVTLPVARIICQRSSCWWDKKLRKSYCQRIKGLILIIILGVISGCLFAKTGTVQLILIFSALVPFIQFTIKQYNDNVAMNGRLEELSKYIDQVWSDIVKGNIVDPEPINEARRIQDGLYDNRTQSPLIFDFFYWRSRSDNEDTMHQAAQKLVDQYLAAQPRGNSPQ